MLGRPDLGDDRSTPAARPPPPDRPAPHLRPLARRRLAVLAIVFLIVDDDADFTSLLVWLPIGARARRSGCFRSRATRPARSPCSSRCSRSASGSSRLAHFDFCRRASSSSSARRGSSDLGVSYHVGVYGFSLWLVGLTVVAMAAAIGYGFWVGRDRPRAYFGLMLFLTGATVGVFVAQDLLLFYAFFEAMLIPLYFLIGVWGGAGRLRRDGEVRHLHDGRLAADARRDDRLRPAGGHVRPRRRAARASSRWIFLGFMFAFVIKAPLFPFHGWLPDAYREAPPEVTAVLSGVIAKAGVYGMLRIAITKFPEPTSYYRTTFLVLAAVALVYGSLLAFRSPDFRGVIAYSSLAQSGLIALGLFSGTTSATTARCCRWSRTGSSRPRSSCSRARSSAGRRPGEFALLGGMARGRPALATLLMTVGVISLAVPGSAAFAGEFLILAGAFQRAWWWAAIGAVAIVLAAMYMLRLISAVLHEARGSTVARRALDLRPGELALARAARRRAARALGVAGRRSRTIRSRPRLADAGDRRSSSSDPHAARRLVRDLADPRLLGASFARAARAPCSCRASLRAAFAAIVSSLGFVGGLVTSVWLYVERRRPRVISRAFYRDRWTALAQVILCGIGLSTSLGRLGAHRAAARRPRRRVLLAPARLGRAACASSSARRTSWCCSSRSSGSRSRSTSCAPSTYDAEGSLEAGLKYLIVGSFGSAALLFGSALVYGATASSASRDRRGGRRAGLSGDALSCSGSR